MKFYYFVESYDKEKSLNPCFFFGVSKRFIFIFNASRISPLKYKKENERIKYFKIKLNT